RQRQQLQGQLRAVFLVELPEFIGGDRSRYLINMAARIVTDKGGLSHSNPEFIAQGSEQRLLRARIRNATELSQNLLRGALADILPGAVPGGQLKQGFVIILPSNIFRREIDAQTVRLLPPDHEIEQPRNTGRAAEIKVLVRVKLILGSLE